MKILLTLLPLLVHLCANAQIFPIQVTPQLIPPYSPYLSDYTAPGAQNFMLQIRANDITISNYPCKLRITIEGVGIRLQTKPDYIMPPIMLDGGGIPQIFYGEDLRQYFHPDALNFSGLSRSAYAKSARLPEGVYRFTVEVLDYNRGTVVSNSGTTMAWIILNDPPILNMPSNFTRMEAQDPTNILFSWTPRHSGSPNAAFNTEYTFRLIEIWPENRNPYDAFLTQPPLFETTTAQNQIVYGPAEPALIPGRKYGWQVEARDTGGKDLFKNHGRSEVFIFHYGETLSVPENFELRWAKPTTLSMRWDPVKHNDAEVKYRLLYRPRRRRENHEWYETRTKFTEKTLYRLEPNTEYEMKVRTEIPAQESEYTETRIFKTLPPAVDVFVCKDPVAPPPVPANTVPVFPLSVNDTLRAGGYEILVRDVMDVGGKYSGSGVAIVPWLNSAKVRVTFENIRVNDRFWLTSGTVKSTWNSESRFLLEEQTPVLPGNAPQMGELDITIAAADSLITIEGSAIAAVTKDEAGNVVVSTTDGSQQTLAKGESYSIVDAAGNGYVVDKQGNVAKTTATGASAVAARGDRKYDLRFAFARGEGKYGFDEKRYDALIAYYQQLEDGSYVPWKALSSTAPDAIEGHLQSGDINAANIRFASGGTPVTPVSTSDGKIRLNIQGKMAGIEEELLALYHVADSLPDNILGKLNLITYNPIHYNLEIVPVNGAGLPPGLDANVIANSLNNIFGQAVVDWQVKVAQGIVVPLPDLFAIGETGMFSNYTADMKKVLNAFGHFQDDTYYLFLIPAADNPSTLGYMPRNRQAGFVFAEAHKGNPDEFLKTFAHELGHGAFNLKHTFSEHNLPAGTTDNIMDYSDGTALYKYQWDYIHEPQAVMGLFEGNEAGESVVITNLAQLKPFANADGSFTFLAPTGIPFTLPATTQQVQFWTNDTYGDGVITADQAPDGALLAFTLENQTYRYHKLAGEKTGTGYKIQKGDTPFVDILSKKQADVERAIIGLPCVEGGSLKFMAQHVSFESNLPDENYAAEGTLVSKLPIDNPYHSILSSPDITLEAKLDFTYSEEAISFIADNEACRNEMVRFVIRAANVIQQNPGFYEMYKACTGNPLRYPKVEHSVVIPSPSGSPVIDPVQVYYERLKEFPEKLLNYIDRIKNGYSDLVNIKEPATLNALLKDACEADFKQFSFAQRRHIIEVLSQGNMHDYWLGLANNRENIVIYALRQTPEEQHEEMLKLLEENGFSLLKTLIAKCHNQLIGEDNFDKLIDAVTVMIQKTSVYEDFEEDVAHDRILRWGTNGYFQEFQYASPEWRDISGHDFIVFNYNSYSPYFLPDGQPFSPDQAKSHIIPFDTVAVSPFDFVVLKLFSDVSLENGSPILKRSVGEFQAVPAIYLYWMIERKATDQTLAHIRANVNVLLFLVGGAEIIAARSAIRLTLAIVDQTMFATSFVLDAGPRRLLEEGPNGAQWQSVFKAYDAFNILYGATRLGQGLSLAAKDILAKRSLLQQLRANEDLRNYTPQQQIIITNELTRVEQGMDELGKVVGDLGGLRVAAIQTQDDIWESLATMGDAADLNSISTQLLLLNVEKRLQKAFLPGWTKEKVRSYSKGHFPPTKTYLSKTYIDNHLQQFEAGVSFFCPRDVIERYGNLLGRSDGVFAIPMRNMDELIRKTNGNLTAIENELGIPTGNWSKRKMCRVDVYQLDGLNLRMPTGNETGANEFFTPGGFTVNGQMEAVLNPIPRNKYTFKEIN